MWESIGEALKILGIIFRKVDDRQRGKYARDVREILEAIDKGDPATVNLLLPRLLNRAAVPRDPSPTELDPT